MTTTQNDKARQEFEAWINGRYGFMPFNLEPHPSSDFMYLDGKTQNMWWAWQAALATKPTALEKQCTICGAYVTGYGKPSMAMPKAWTKEQWDNEIERARKEDTSPGITVAGIQVEGIKPTAPSGDVQETVARLRGHYFPQVISALPHLPQPPKETQDDK